MRRKLLVIGLIAGSLVGMGFVGLKATSNPAPAPSLAKESVESTPRKLARPASPLEHDFSDVDFATKKLQHHQLGAFIAEKAATDAITPELRLYASQVREIETKRASVYASMLDSWGEKYLNLTDFPETNGCHGYPTFNGMLSVTEVGRYQLSSGIDVDKKFFELMVDHHKGNEVLSNAEGKLIGYGDLVKLRDVSQKEYDTEIAELTGTQTKFGL